MANRTDPEAKTIHGTNPQVHSLKCCVVDLKKTAKCYDNEALLISAEYGGKDSADENL